VDGVNRQI